MLLDEIIFNKRQEVTALKLKQSQLNLKKLLLKAPKPRNFIKIFKKSQLALIAETKKASPSAGIIRRNYKPASIARTYAKAGAAAISVLTDQKYFQGKLKHLKAVRKAVKIPILCKDFILDEAQVYSARLAGADAVLLIVRVLTDSQLINLLALVRRLGMYSLVEVHNAEEVKRVLKTEAKVIGINNRDLDTLQVNFETTTDLLKLFPKLKNRIVVSESGIKTREDVQRLKQAGVNGVLIGHRLLTRPQWVAILLGSDGQSIQKA
ncbi:MAG: indole-3-glycerol phosphate synthase TrpC [Candidatus Margulisbacteria bacterium]|nr:indole-3-glycerol phosphate synthase TrpC [Candidatus Margulisiibacteriota bacterium]